MRATGIGASGGGSEVRIGVRIRWNGARKGDRRKAVASKVFGKWSADEENGIWHDYC